ncbi:LPXTG cell wall anchor domain-containing protein [Vagococcus carniphilus]|uniref:LPXTG cell wall anchor domain-containing protein n=1 Tax=Vagococcus carniphilus TaxID=218144 RepID=UPI00288D9A9E|nr:LPXTG cell wall anchor domain-containing protein [Vagococcus carniphilus]MDT2814263.1 LPXTG cell wall anchor domain-containing protein [Vagococcus carniphilus]MDT2864451.1 LPXTG cell wall anchor domain-containing protein [Vagococcus carniphilus]
MKKNSLRLSAVVLACVPLLIGGTQLTHAEEVTLNQTASSSEVADAKPQAGESADTTLEKDTTKESGTKEDTSETKEISLKLEANKISGKKGDSGKIKLVKIENTELKGEFKPFKNTFIEVDKNGTWTAKAKTEKKDEAIQLEFKPNLKDKATKDALTKAYPTVSFDETKEMFIKTEKISVTFTDADKPIDPVKDKAVLPITVANKKDKLIVSVKDSELKATFTALKNDKIDLKSDGTFTIPEKNKDAKFTEKVTLSLDTADANYKKIAESDAYKGKEIQTEYKDLDAAITRPEVKTINLTYTVKELTAKINGGGTLAFNDVDGVKITGTFKEIKDNEFFSLDAKGNWKAKKPGEGSIDPTFTISKESLAELQKKYPEQELKIETGLLKVNFTETGSGSNQKKYAPVNKKQYAPVKKLPQTGEEKMRFAGIIGIVVLVIVGLIFFMKKKKNDDDNTNEDNN